MLAVEIAKYLHAQGVAVFDEAGVTGNTFISVQPSTPDVVIALFPTGGYLADVKLGYDQPTLQIQVRGTRDPRVGQAKAQEVYDALHGLHDIALPDGTWLVKLEGIQSAPNWLKTDENYRHIYSVNFQAEVRNLTTHRE